MGKRKNFTLAAVISYGAIFFNIVTGLIYTPWMISVIGDDHYALYSLAISIINAFLLDFGIGSAVTKFLSKYYAEGKQKEADIFIGIVYKVFIAISAVIAVCLTIFYFLTDAIYAKLTFEELRIFKGLFIIVASYGVLSFPFTTFNGVLMANERFVEVKACNFGQKVFNVLLIVVMLLSGQGVFALVFVNAFSNVIFLIIKYIFIKKKTNQKAKLKAWDKSIAKGLFGYSAWMTVMTIAHRFIFNIMPTLITVFIGPESVTVFSLATILEGYVYLFSDAINGMFMPKISRIIAKGEEEQKLTGLMTRVGQFHIYTIGLIFIGILTVGREFVSVWMGEGYEAVYICAVILIFPSLISVPQQIARTTLLAKNIVKEQAIVYTAMAVINVLLSVILIPLFGVVGASLSIFLAYLIRTVGMNFLYHKKLPIKLWEYFKTAYGKWLLVAIPTIIMGFVISHFVALGGWIGFILKGGLVTVIYCILLLLFCIDKKQIKSFLKK